MQETKCTPAQFPHDAFAAAGYDTVAHGVSAWNGVAFASRVPLTDVQFEFPAMPGFASGVYGVDVPAEARALGVRVGGTTLWSLYVPNGRGLTDPHYGYKLEFYTALREHVAASLAADPSAALVLMGDFNVAPFDTDNGDPAVVVGSSTHVSPEERTAFASLLTAGLTDLTRERVPPGAFTYWDYQRLRFPRNEGMRIDFILGSASVAEQVTDAAIHREERKGAGPSDHVPVTIDLAADPSDDLDGDSPMVLG